MKTLMAAFSKEQSGSRVRVQASLRRLPAAPWPSRGNVQACLQLLSVLQWILSYLVMGAAVLLLLIYLAFTNFWPISALYLAWVIFDWDTPEKGGRSSSWVRNWSIWNHFRDYFPVQLVKTCNLAPSHNYIIGVHPHGILSVGAFCNFVTRSTGFCDKFPGINPFLATLAGNFNLPALREYLLSGGLCPVTRRAISYLISRNGTGNAVAIVVGGAAEALSCQPGVITLVLKKRKGFVRMALQHGAHLVPAFSFGENDLFQQVVFEEGTWMKALQNRFRRILGFSPCLFYGRGVTSIHSRGFLPFPRPVTTVIGGPVPVPKIEQPTRETVDLYHALYMEALLKLFNDHKVKYGLSAADELRIL
ncbi:diacylglycerol O-acyltransferase 2-like isoform X2 [Hemicordylus capensis]|uniref:diacylglycerol O-acyltransferase 2-like isoform X2 n=1 Tax=Hemicordylus capensis TaxID=884348 RepID=UPI002302CC62|nr:diacylglycerol O-acyltransferase 2-like isoform X2 [Hemicordylus capensis]XP_053130280.1 diacylglycerol O-acyltransferase 2-like isoform X2 [Hemicordylus capensis]